MIKFTFDECAKIETKAVGSLANGLRRVLLDEIKTYTFDTSNATLETNDPYLTFDLLRSIEFVRFLNPFVNPSSSFSSREKEEKKGDEFYIKIKNVGNDHISILSSLICYKSGKPVDFVEVWEVGTLSPGCHLAISGIGITSGIGREHAKFSAVFGPVTYRPTDVTFVYYLNDKGKIEDNVRAVPTEVLSKITGEKIKDLVMEYLIWNEDWSKKMSKEDKELAASLKKISYNGNYCFTEISDCNDFEITFNAHKPEQTFKEACKVIARDIQGDPNELTITAGEILRWFCFQEMECPIFGNFDRNNYKIKINHVDEKKIIQNAINKILSILKPFI